MVFSSPTFLFLFLPVVLLGAWLSRRSWRNVFLLIASLIFYAWGEPFYVLLLLFSCVMNYAAGLWIGKTSAERRKLPLTLGIIGNLALLGFFKYTNLICDTINTTLAAEWVRLPDIPLPIGISFFTFQALSYLIDIHRGHVAPQRSLINLTLYISMFPQLIAGPIVRYEIIAHELTERSITWEKFAYGIRRFIIGLSKKVIIADAMAGVADTVFALPPDQCTTALVWVALLAYGLQIYFDFSGYSDMAIGLGAMFGFSFPENFNYPYIASSVKEFWRRWHLTLSTWFRDYLYIPLGGNRCGKWRNAFNLALVFALCGIWHGASWSFLIWGLYHGFFLIIERGWWGRMVDRLWAPVKHLYLIFIVLIGWLFFRVEDFGEALRFLGVLFGFGASDVAYYPLPMVVDTEAWIVMAVGIIAATPLFRLLSQRTNSLTFLSDWTETIKFVLLYVLFCLAIILMVSSTHSPFLYFRF
ncbi:MBOAT family O-acyltransferase [Cerasicoccus frondis]|uniref:MBOAT family O-acyltransferase n=1 Tax=Cerasicoccus frondis TaxID=490090 RepID=UPI0028527245|nr:MBOAT family O-acyltransferase [Cerasicoccus frondis]